MSLERITGKIRQYIEITGVDEIARRYFVMNGFDGALTILGVVIGAYVAGVSDPRPIISAGIGGSLAMGISGFFGAYMAEKAERGRRIKELEGAMLCKLDNSVIKEASRFAMVIVALVDGVSPALASMIVISPFALSLIRAIPFTQAVILSILLCLSVLFILGAFLGRISQENILAYGVAMVSVGLLTAFICSFLRAL